MSTEQALLLPVGSDLYALPLAWAREVVATPAVTRLVTAPATVLGLFNLRGQVIPLLDTAALLGTGTISAPAYAIVVDGVDGLAGLATTGVPRRETLGAQAASSELAGTSGRYRVGQEVATLLDPAVLLTPDRISGHDYRDLAGNGST
jgi:chemotaxis signal transduction protein